MGPARSKIAKMRNRANTAYMIPLTFRFLFILGRSDVELDEDDFFAFVVFFDVFDVAMSYLYIGMVKKDYACILPWEGGDRY